MDNFNGVSKHLITLVKMGMAEEVARCPEVIALSKDSRYLDYKLLRLAVKFNEIGIVEIFTARGFRVNPDASQDEPADTPLHFAVERNRGKMLQLLLRHDASVEHKNQHGLTPLQVAVKLGNSMAVDIIMYQLEKRDYLRHLTIMGHLTPMHAACLRGDLDELRHRLEAGANLKEPVPLNSPIWPGCTNLHLAVIAHDIDMMEFLVSCGIEIVRRDAMNLTALELAVKTSCSSLAAYLLRFYIDQNVGLTWKNRNGMTLLHMACTFGSSKLELSHDLIKLGADIHATTSQECTEAPGFTPLHFACKSGSFYDVRVLMENGADPTVKNGNGETPLHLATRRPEIMMVCFRNYTQFKTNTKDSFGTSHFHLACLYGQFYLVCGFLDSNPNIDYNERVKSSPSIIEYHGSTPLHLAVRLSTKQVTDECQSRVVGRLLECDHINVNAVDFNGQTPLHIIMETGYKPFTTEVLLSDKNVNANMRNRKGQIPLHIAVQQGKLSDQVNWLLHAHSNMLARDHNGQTPIHLAHKNIMPLLLYFYMRINQFIPSRNPRDMTGRSIFDIACDHYKVSYARSIVNGFLENDLNDQAALIGLKRIRMASGTALHAAAEGRYLTTVDTLLRLGLVNTNDKGFRGATALHVLAADDSIPSLGDRRMEIAEILIEEGVDIEAATNDCKSTALHWAAKSNSIRIAEVLLKHKASLLARDIWKNTPLLVAAQYCSVEVLQMLIRAGADVNVCDDIGCTALHKASGATTQIMVNGLPQAFLQESPTNSIKQYNELIDALLYSPKSHGNIDVKNVEGLTPLCLAYEIDNYACTKAFLDHGANPENAWHRMTRFIEDFEYKSGTMLLIAKQMLRLRVARLIEDPKWDNENWNFGVADGTEGVLREDCREELTRMAEVHIDSYTTLKDLLYKNVFALRPHMSNCQLQNILLINLSDTELEQELTLLQNKYPNYALLLRRTYRYALMLQEELVQEADRALQAIANHVIPEETAMRVMPGPCIEAILKMVNVEDVHNLVEAVFYKKV